MWAKEGHFKIKNLDSRGRGGSFKKLKILTHVAEEGHLAEEGHFGSF